MERWLLVVVGLMIAESNYHFEFDKGHEGDKINRVILYRSWRAAVMARMLFIATGNN